MGGGICGGIRMEFHEVPPMLSWLLVEENADFSMRKADYEAVISPFLT